MTEADFILKTNLDTIEKGTFSWSSPSNIALVKYWGKRANQIPNNPSISFTLNACKTTTTLGFQKKEDNNQFSFRVFLDGKPQDAFKPKIETFFNRILPYMPFLKDFHFEIETSNTFPHSSGIASSASGMSALALCLMSMEKYLTPKDAKKPHLSNNYFYKKASFLARLGSGSASRSIKGNIVVWGIHKYIKESSNLFGVPFPYTIHEYFENYHDTILLVDKGEKQVSSSVGHELMNNHPFAKQRFEQAHKNLFQLINVFKVGDLETFINIIESEALTLHAMMMTSNPYFILIKPNTLNIINSIWNFRKKTGLHLCFTLDAGANVHVLYPEHEADDVYAFIKKELVVYCQNGHYICDRIGFGAKKLSIDN